MPVVGNWWDADLFAGGYRLSGDSREIRLAYAAEMLDGTCFGMETKKYIPGLMSIDLTVSGLMPAASAQDLKESHLFSDTGASDIPVSVFPENTPVEGSLAYFFKSARAQLQIQGQHGQLFGFSLQAHGGDSGDPLVRGYVLEPGRTKRTANGNGTGTNRPGTVSETQHVLAVLHVFAVEGTNPTLDVTVESAPAANFAGASARITFARVSSAATGIYAAKVNGPITDTYWRATWTVGGVNPGYSFAAAVGVIS